MGDRFVVASDFHLGRGIREKGSGPRLELFRHDAAFSSFIDDIRRRAEEDSYALNLIILGDFLDFPRVPSAPGTRAGSDDDAVAKLREIALGHPDVFMSLARFLESGGILHLLPGNHDVELLRPAVRAAVQRTLDPAGAGEIRWYPWFMLIPDLLYAEHGNQYHDINSFPALVEIERVPISGAARPIGALYDEHVIHLTQLVGARSASSTIRLSNLIGILGRNPTMLARSIPSQARFGIQLVAQGLAMRKPIGGRRRRRYRQEDLEPFATRMDLPIDAVIAIDRIAEEIASGFWGRLGRGIGTMARTRIAGRKAGSSGERDLGFPSSPAQRATLLRDVAGEIDRILANAGRNAPFYVFGHTHLADCAPVNGGNSSAICLNAGSWLVTQADSFDLTSEQPLMTFIEIDRNPGHNPTARLMIWDDQQGRPEAYAPNHA